MKASHGDRVVQKQTVVLLAQGEYNKLPYKQTNVGARLYMERILPQQYGDFTQLHTERREPRRSPVYCIRSR
jgi:hypothetical protein